MTSDIINALYVIHKTYVVHEQVFHVMQVIQYSTSRNTEKKNTV